MKQAHEAHGQGAPKRVLFVASSPNLLGGAEHCLVDVVTNIGATGWEPCVVVPGEGTLAAALREAGVPVDVIDLGVLRHRGEARSLTLLVRLAAAVRASRRITRVIKARDIAIVHSNAAGVIAGALAARQAHVPHVWHVRELLHGRTWNALRRAMFRYSSVILCISRCVADHVERGGRGPASVEVLSDGIDVSQFRPNEVPSESNAVVMLSRIHPDKGHEVFIRAAALVARRVPEARFELIGGCLPVYEPLRRQFVALIEELDLVGCAALRSDVTRDEAAEVIRNADVVVVPSQWVEPGGLVVLEAMACGKPVVAPNRGGPAEVIDDGVNGFLVPIDEPSCIADVVDQLLRSRELRTVIGQHARERVIAGFDVRNQVRELADLYGRLAPERVDACA